STSYPQMLSWGPFNGETGVPLDEEIQMEFNQSMDPDSVADNFSLLSGDGQQITGTMEWDEEISEFVFIPDQLFLRSTSYAGILPGEVISAGGTPLQTDTTFDFQTTGDFQYLGTPGGQIYTTSIYEGATLYFNNTVDKDTVADNITIIPEVTNLSPSPGGSGNVLTLYGDFEPLTNYTLILRESLADEWGSILGNVRTVNFTTEPLPPNLTITQGINILFLTGMENTIRAQSTNLHQMSINVGTIPTDVLPALFGAGLYETLEDYYPSDAQYWTHLVSVPGDDKYTVNLPLNQSGKALAPGLYRYQIYSQELPYNPSPYLVAVSNIHLTMKTSPENLLIWAVDLRSGEVVPDAEVKVYNTGGEVFFSGTTDQEGVFQADFPAALDLYNNVFYAITGEAGQEDFGITASNWGFGSEPYEFGLRSDYGAPKPQTYIYTDRPIYQPGQTVYYRLIHRDRDGAGYALPEQQSIPLTIHLHGKEENTINLPLSEYGTAQGEIQLSTQAEPGYYRLESETGMVYFQVANYRKPEIELELNMDQDETLIGEEFQVELDARYYFDAPASDVQLSWTLRAEPTSFRIPGYQVGELGSNWFVYPGANSPSIWGTRIDSGEDQTNANGEWSIEKILTNIDIYDREVTLPANYFLEITAQDETGFQVTNRSAILVHPSDFYLGVKPSAWVTVADQAVDFEILAVDWEKEQDGIKTLSAEFYKVVWQYEIGEIGEIDYIREKELVAEQSFSTNLNGEAELTFSPTEPGTYQLDIFGDGARTEVTLWVGGPGTTAWPTQTNQKITLIADQDLYKPGDEATIFIPNPFPDGAQALVSVERHKIISYETYSISSSGQEVTIPMSDANAPNVYLAVTLIGQDSEGRSSFRQGYINLLVEPVDKVLQVEVVGEPERLGPGEEVQFTLRVADQNGEPLEGEFSLAVVDKAVLALTEPNSPRIEEAFYGIQPIAVRTGLPLGMHAGRLVWMPGGLGGGGDADYSVRDQFEDTGYWQANIVTDEDGLAQVVFNLPDNLTTWQADARGITKQTQVGEATAEVVTTKNLLIRPVTPRFLVAGDHLALAAVIHNNTGIKLTADVSLQGAGIQLDIPEFSTQTVEIPAEGRVRVEWWGTVEDVDEVDLIFAADAGFYQDSVKPYQGPLPVLRYIAPYSYTTAGLLDQAGQKLEIVSLPKSFDPSDGALDIELSPSLAAAVLKALDALEEDQHYTVVAQMFHFLPNTITYQTLQEVNVDYPQLENRLENLIPETLDVLDAAQNDDGGWGWWQDGASDPEISSYILFGLIEAQEAGVFVEDLMIQQARGYLLATLPALEMLSEPWQYNLLALRYFALTEAGTDVSSGMQALASLSSQLDPGSQALLAIALEKGQPGNDSTRSLLSNLAGTGIRTSTGIHWENDENRRSWMNNTTTTTAIVTYALARVEEAPDLYPEAVRYLVSTQTQAGDWWSAYETGWSVLALNEVLRKSGELDSGYEFSSTVNGRELISGQAQGSSQLEAAYASIPVEDLYPEEPNALVINRSEGSGVLYYRSHLQVYRPAEDVQPYGHGMTISRVYADLSDPEDINFTQKGEIGQLIQVQLTLVLENDSYYLMVEDQIPAGAEILDTRLKTSRQDLEEYQAAAPFKNGWGWWYFNTPLVLDDRVTWAVNFLPAGTYQLTYTISLAHPGEYQVL
ncbi:MAG: Ig-like domain-containing protein, partial [Anaerolineales bacterium]|nr:Ig-like domain-containing protein [Anaerolineales bacterium]